MSVILYSGMAEFQSLIEKAAKKLHATLSHITTVNNRELRSADLVMIGPETSEAIPLLQKISAADHNISIVVLCRENEMEGMKQKLLYTPFLSKNITCLKSEENFEKKIEQHIVQTRLRREFTLVSLKASRHVTSFVSNPSKIEHIGFLNQAPVSAILLNKNMNVLALNKAAKMLFDMVYESEESVRLEDLMDEPALSQFKKMVLDKAENGLLQIESTYQEVTVSEVVNRENERFNLVLLNDITERKFQEERIRTILNSLPQMAWITDSKGDITYLSSRWFEYTGQKMEEAKGNGWTQMLHPEDKKKFFTEWSISVKSGLTFEQEARFKSASGEYRWHLVRGIFVRRKSAKLDYWVGTCTDIDDQKQTEQKLEKRVRERTEQLHRMNEKLQSSYLELEQFAYITTHDLQEPIRKVLTFSNLLFDQAHERLEKKDLALLDKIINSSKRLRQQIIDVLTYTRLLQSIKHTPYSYVRLNDVLKNAVKEHETTIKAKKATIDIDELPAISGVEKQLQQLFSSLISNSLKFIESEKVPKIRVSYTAAHPEELTTYQLDTSLSYIKIIYEDNGIGLDSRYSDYIFNLFRRLHTQEEFPGTGIGLALCRKIVENHQGKILTAGRKGIGTVFTIFLPEKLETPAEKIISI